MNLSNSAFKKSPWVTAPRLILYLIVAVATVTILGRSPKSLRSFAEIDLPEPWNHVTNLSEDQKRKIQEILTTSESSIETRKQTISAERTAFLKRQNAMRLAKIDIAQWTKDMIKGFRIKERDDIMKLLNPEQQREAMAALANILQTTEIVEFEAFKARQQNDYFCWAACLQMLFNYAGVDWDQDQIANEIKGTSEAQTATPQEISKGGTGWRINPKDPSKNWSADVGYHKDGLDDSVVVGMLGFNRFIFVELGGRHVGILYKATYRETLPKPTVETVTIYDPLTANDVILKFSDEAPKQITGWWEAIAISSPSRVF